MDTPSKPKPFSMIREFHLADWFTLGNAVAGVGALFSVMTYLQSGDVDHVLLACALIPVAFVFDVLDGRIARWRQQSSPLGRELDSLADVISFGVAPAAIAYGCGMQGLIDRVILVIFVACGLGGSFCALPSFCAATMNGTRPMTIPVATRVKLLKRFTRCLLRVAGETAPPRGSARGRAGAA